MTHPAKTSAPGPAADGAALTAGAADSLLGPNPFVGLRRKDMIEAALHLAAAAVDHPALVVEQNAALVRDLAAVAAGRSTKRPADGDKRFADPAWRDRRPLQALLQGYLAWCDALSGFIAKSGADTRRSQQMQFIATLVTDALAPTNNPLANPAALRKAVQTRGRSLLAGLRNAARDIVGNHGLPSQVDKSAFELGRNLALSPGAVVYRNEVLELIQYTPATPRVRARAHLIVPPQINKFYIFDLAPGRSIVEFLVGGGFPVFAISWRNPSPEHRDWTIDTYVAALIEAIEAVRDIHGGDDVILHGACSGAMTMSATLGYLAATGRPLVKAATLMVAVLDSKVESMLGLFASRETIAAAKLSSRAKGVLDGQEMGRVFTWMRPNDLFWNYWVNNYLLGNPPPVFDILYWNNDTTRLPAQFHAELLDVFVDNAFRAAGGLTVMGKPIDLAQVTCDTYFVAGTTDHITPWKGVYNSARLMGGDSEFVLSASGHIQSLICPPGNAKAKYFLNSARPAEPEAWLAGAKPQAGSWWPHWRAWLDARSGDLGPAPKALGNARHRPLGKAPGLYVFEP